MKSVKSHLHRDKNFFDFISNKLSRKVVCNGLNVEDHLEQIFNDIKLEIYKSYKNKIIKTLRGIRK